MSEEFAPDPRRRQSVLGSTVNKWLKSSHDFLSQARIARFGVFSPKGMSGTDSVAVIVGEAVVAGISVTYTVTTLSSDYQAMIRRQLREFDTDLLNQRLFSDGREIEWIIDASLLLSDLNPHGALSRDDELFGTADVGIALDDMFDEREKLLEDDYDEEHDPATQPPPEKETEESSGSGGGEEDGEEDEETEDAEGESDPPFEPVDDDDLLLPSTPPPTNNAPVLDVNNYASTFTENNYAVQTTPTPVNVIDVSNITVSDPDGVLDSVTVTISNLQDTGFEILSATASGTVSIDSSMPGTLVLSGASSNSEYEDVLKTMTYTNISDSPTEIDRTITITLDDGITTISDTTTVSVVAVNDNDIFSFTNASFDANDTIVGDSGTDTLRLTDTATITAAELANKTGIDVIQFDGAGNSITFDSNFVDNSDTDSVELSHGTNTITQLDTSNVNSAHTVVIGGTGDVTLADGANNKVSAKDGVNTAITGGTGSDTIIGGSGDDTFTGGQGIDSITGGSGDDIYKWTGNNESGTGSGSRDIITDFSQSDTDQIDLSFISNGQYIGIYDFISGTNTVRYEQTGGNTIVEVDSNGDGTTDFEIELTGAIDLTRNDFIGLSANNPIEVSDLDGPTGFKINGIDAGDAAGTSVSSAGDFNNDGFDDFIIGARDADPNGISGAGETYLIFGKAATFNTPFELSDLNGTNGFQINGISSIDQSGIGINDAGDFNGDGIDDIIIGTRYGDANATDAGESYIIFGTTSSLGTIFELSDLNGTNGFRLDGISADDQSGIELNTAGDVNNDGYDDVIITGFLADPNGTDSGEAYVVFGTDSITAASFDLSDLNGTNGFRLDGIDANDQLRSAGPAGDLNGDGFDDVIVHARHGDPNGLTDAGESYVIYGKSSGFAANINLSTLDGTNGFQINGTAAGNAEAGVHTLGDINGDGIDDLIIAARYADPNGLTDAGQAYVIYGSTSGFANPFELSDLNGSNGFFINGVAANDQFYLSNVDGADINADGYNDIIIGSWLANPESRADAGATYVIFGGTNLSTTFELSDLDGFNGFQFNGETAGDQIGWSANSAGDINGDGYEDIVVGARRADPDGRINAGEGYVIYGSDHTYQATHLGTTGNDGSLAGDSSANYIDALAGNDSVTGDGGNDTLIGGQGNDTLDGGTGNDVLIAASGDDRVIYDSSDTLRVDGGLGEDTLAFNSSVTLTASDLNPFDRFEVFEFSGTGNSLVINQNIMNRSDDTFIEMANGSNTITSLDTSSVNHGDVIIGGTGHVTLANNTGNRVVGKTGVNNSITGGTGADIIAFAIAAFTADDIIAGGTGTDNFEFTDTSGITITAAMLANKTGIDAIELNGSGNTITLDQSFVGNSDSNSVEIVNSTNTITSLNTNGVTDDVVIGGTGAVTLADGANNRVVAKDGVDNVIIGGDGSDTMIGSTGSDSFTGNEGNDVFVFAEADFAASDTVAGDTGTDTLQFTDTATITTAELANKTSIDVIQLDGTNNNVTLSDTFVDASDSDNVELSFSTNTLTLDTSNVNAARDVVINGTGVVTLSGNSRVLSKAGVNTSIEGSSANETIVGNTGDDTINSSTGVDSIVSGGGDDSVTDTGNGNNYFDLGTGNDTLILSLGFDNNTNTIIGGAGLDVITGANSQDSVTDTLGDNSISTGAASDTIVTGDGDDTIDSGIDSDSIVSGAGDDSVTDTGNGNNYFDLGAGNDTLTLSAGHGSYTNTIIAGAGNDVIIAADSNDSITATSGNNSISGGNNNDTIITGDGDDTIDAGPTHGSDSIVSGGGDDSVTDTGNGNNYFDLGAGNDTLTLSAGHGSSTNTVIGGAGNDVITGANSSESITAGDGVDNLTSGGGNDTLIWTAESESGIGSGNRDIVTDFSSGNDTIDLSIFNNLVFLGTSSFVSGSNGVRYEQTGGNTIIQVDNDGDATTNFEIELTGLHTLTSSDVSDATDPVTLDLNGTDAGLNFSAAFVEDSGAVTIVDTDATLTDLDDTNLESGTVTISNLLDGADEVLAATTTGTNVTANYDSGTGVLTLSGTDTLANYLTVLKTVTYNNTSDTPNTTDRTIDFVLNDGTSNGLTSTTTLSVAATNDPPVVDLNGSSTGGTGFSNTFTENDYQVSTTPTPVNITDASNALLSDPEGDVFTSVTITITNLLDTGFENLAATASGSVTINSSTPGVLVLENGASNAEYQTVLRTVMYVNTHDDPNTTDRSISVVADDATDTTSATATISITPVTDNDTFTSTDAAFISSLTIVGDSGTDRMVISDAANISTSDLSNKSNLEELELQGAINTVILTDTFVDSSSTDQVELIFGTNTVTLDTSNVNAARDVIIGSAGVVTLSGNSRVLVKAGVDASISGSNASETILGNSGDDTFSVALGSDSISGGDGNDVITGTGSNSVDGGAGDDSIVLSAGSGAENNTVIGGAGLDTITTTAGSDNITDTLGAASISSGSGSDTIVTGDAHDTINAGNGTNSITSGDGDDVVTGSGHNYVDAGAGDDTITLSNNTISGSATEHDTVIGGAGLDVITTASGNDSITDTLGAASINSGSGSDTIVTGVANDTIIAGVGANNITAGDGDDSITNDDSGGGSTILAGDGDDTIIGTGDNSVVAGDGDDLITLSLNIVSGPASEDNTVDGGAGLDTITTTIGNDSITDTLEAASINSGSGNDTIITGDANDTINAGNGTNSITSGDGDDVITGSGHNYVDAGAGNDTITLSNNTISGSATEHDTVIGGAGLDVITTASGNDSITDTLEAASISSGGGSDTIVTGSGNDTINVGSSNDMVIAGDGNDVITGTGSNSVDGGAGNDSIVLSAGVGSENNTVIGGAGLDTITTSFGSDSITDTLGAASINSNSGSDTITTGDANDTIISGSGDDSISSSLGDDSITTNGPGTSTILAGGGNDTITGSGNNSVDGGAGNDSIVLTAGTGNENNTVIGGAGLDTITTTSGSDSITDTLEAANISSSSGSDTITTGNANDTIDAGNGSDSIISGDGNDSITTTATSSNNKYIDAGDGNDTIAVLTGHHSASTTIIGGAGLDVISSAGATNDSITDTIGAASINSSSGSDTITTGDANDTIISGSGDDSISSGLGDDSITTNGPGTSTILAGGGNDTITGSGNNSVDGGAGNDSIVLTAGTGNENNTVIGGAGLDTITTTSGSDSITDTLEAANISSSSGSDTITTGNANDTIDAGNGSDSIISGDGNDSITTTATSSNNKYIDAGDGNDTIAVLTGHHSASTTIIGGAGLDVISSAGSTADSITDTIGAASISSGDGSDSILTGSANDTIDSDAQYNTATINSGAGDDSITGIGSHSLNAGDGNDTINFTDHTHGSHNNTVIGGAGIDIITTAKGNDSITDTIEVASINSGAGNDTIITGSGNDTINSSSGSDSITSGDGNDSIDAGNGSDSIISGDGNDSITTTATSSNSKYIDAGDGNDTIAVLTGHHSASTTIIGGAGLDVISSAGSTADSITDTIGAASISSGDGSDSILTGSANDTIDSDAQYNTATINSGAGDDSITGIGSHSLNAGDGNDTINFTDHTHGSHNNTILGGDGNDSISTAKGTDSITGGDGVDTLTGGTGSDTLIWTAESESGVGSGNRDIVAGFTIGTDRLDLSSVGSFTFIGTDAFSGTKNEVRYTQTGGNTIVEVDSDNDGSTNFEIELTGLLTPTVDDIIGATSPPSASFELSSLDGTNGFQLNGVDAGDNSGWHVRNAGDINGDGYDDLLISAFNADPNSTSNAGETYVVFGKAANFTTPFELSSLATGGGTEGFQINGPDTVDSFAGNAITADINGDGIDDLLIGAYNSGGSDEGGAYVIFGKTTAFSQTIDLTSLNGTDGFAITAPSTTDQLTGFSVHFADINNDGIDDAILGAPSDVASVNNIGKAYVVFGQTSSFGSSFDLTNLNGTNGFEINGTSTDDALGRAVSATDINGDGIEDLILGVPSGDPSSGADAGQVAVIFGSSSSFSSTFEMSDLNGTNGFVVEGVSANDASGMDVSSAGDVNGDGIDDLLIGAPDADPNTKSSAGTAYVVFGSTSAFSATFALSDLDGSNGFEIYGDTSGDELGRWISGGGDFNGDGYDDILVGAPFGDPNALTDASEFYVIFGDNSFSTTLEVSDLDGTNGFVLNGISSNDFGTTDSADPVSFGGDINGDGFDDIVVAAQGGDPNSNADSGESYVIYGYDYTNTATNSGTSSADTLTGTTNDDFIEGLAGNDSLTGAGGDDTLVGGQGDDTLDGGGGADNLIGGSGDDILAIDDLSYFNIDGGLGMDTLRVDGSGLNMDLSTLSQSRVEGIEVIDLTGSGNNSLTLTLEDVFEISDELNTLPATDTANTLFIDGDSGDSVTSTGEGWASQGTVSINSIDYTHYTSGSAAMYVDTDITATIS